MLFVLNKSATKEEIEQMARDFDGYIKFVVDIEKNILTGGGERHVDGEQKLLTIGSKQENLWGGGIDWQTKEIDYNSMINLRPGQGNPSREVLSAPVRTKIDVLVKKFFNV